MSTPQLGAELGVPPFRLLLPPGWVELEANAASAEEMLAHAKQVFQQANRPDLDAEMRRITREAFEQMRLAQVFALYLQRGVGADDLLPMSITAAVVDGPDGSTLDSRVASLLRERGAQFLDDNRAVVRWEGNNVQTRGDLAGAAAHTLSYLVAIPDTGRRKAVILQTTISFDKQHPLAPDIIESLTLLSDSIVGTFSWAPAAA